MVLGGDRSKGIGNGLGKGDSVLDISSNSLSNCWSPFPGHLLSTSRKHTLFLQGCFDVDGYRRWSAVSWSEGTRQI
jgi:hypothetical protein